MIGNRYGNFGRNLKKSENIEVIKNLAGRAHFLAQINLRRLTMLRI
jgi:hypothetical protein